MIGQRYTHRDRKMLDLAHGLHECTLGIPDVCRGYMVDGCIPCHLNGLDSGRGSGRKAHDVLHAAGCDKCHNEVDHGKSLSREDRQFYLARGFQRTMLEYLKRGWIGVTIGRVVR